MPSYGGANQQVPVSYGFLARGAWRSLVSALVWGTKGREFESRRPDRDRAYCRSKRCRPPGAPPAV